MIAYEENPAECNRLAISQGYSTICVQETSDTEQPAFGLYITSSATGMWEVGEDGKLINIGLDINGRSSWNTKNNRYYNNTSNNNSKNNSHEAILVIRGTQSIQDVVTDIRASPVSFPPPRDEILKAIYGGSYSDKDENNNSNNSSSSNNNINGIFTPSRIGNTQEWEWLPNSQTKTYACGGIFRSAMYILSEIGACLVTLAEQDFKITIVGHSFGGAVATLVIYLLQSISIPAVCFAYGSPSCVDEITSDQMKSYVTTVILHDDLIARITPASIRILLKDIHIFRQTVFKHLNEDWNDVLSRALSLWSPKQRNPILESNFQIPNQSVVTLETSAIESELNEEENHHNNNTTPNNSNNTNSNNKNDHNPEDNDGILVSEEEVIQLWLPGKIIHIYARRGVYNATIVPRDFSELRRIIVQGNIFNNHSSMSIFEALQEVFIIN